MTSPSIAKRGLDRELPVPRVERHYDDSSPLHQEEEQASALLSEARGEHKSPLPRAWAPRCPPTPLRRSSGGTPPPRAPGRRSPRCRGSRALLTVAEDRFLLLGARSAADHGGGNARPDLLGDARGSRPDDPALLPRLIPKRLGRNLRSGLADDGQRQPRELRLRSYVRLNPVQLSEQRRQRLAQRLGPPNLAPPGFWARTAAVATG